MLTLTEAEALPRPYLHVSWIFSARRFIFLAVVIICLILFGYILFVICLFYLIFFSGSSS